MSPSIGAPQSDDQAQRTVRKDPFAAVDERVDRLIEQL